MDTNDRPAFQIGGPHTSVQHPVPPPHHWLQQHATAGLFEFKPKKSQSLIVVWMCKKSCCEYLLWKSSKFIGRRIVMMQYFTRFRSFWDMQKLFWIISSKFQTNFARPAQITGIWISICRHNPLQANQILRSRRVFLTNPCSLPTRLNFTTYQSNLWSCTTPTKAIQSQYFVITRCQKVEWGRLANAQFDYLVWFN